MANRADKRRGPAGFTLIELMIVVAIIGILAAIALPQFLRFQMRARAVEGKTNLAAIRTAEQGYFGEFSTYVACSASPGAPSSFRQPWTDNGGFDVLGWAPEGEVHYQYSVEVAAGPGPYDHFTAEAISDLDDNGAFNAYGYVKTSAFGVSIPGTLAGDPAVDCPATGVYDFAFAVRYTDQVGPCQLSMTQTIF